MHQFVETIRIEGGKAINLSLHEARMNATRMHFAPHTTPISLQKWLDDAPISDERIKARVVYDVDGVCDTTYQTYKCREIQWLRMMEDNNINYTFKSTDRHELDRLLALRNGCDEVIIVKNGLITDTSFTNVAFFDGHKWVTPAQPLLNGTRLSHLVPTHHALQCHDWRTRIGTPHHTYYIKNSAPLRGVNPMFFSKFAVCTHEVRLYNINTGYGNSK